MIIRLSLRRTLIPLAIIMLLALPALLILGRAFTPIPPRPFTWTDWQVRQARAAYTAELTSLRRDAESLAALVNAPTPDPVQAQIVAVQIGGRWQVGLPALSERRSALVTAAQAVSDWAVGATPREPAQHAVQIALRSLEEADDGLGAR
ncbi:hypothetical protein ANRL4_04207 [Anaerolineae bacterium]|nr:hypothetical protein ANRL4_04207 [Anaerolineae bacterium]